MNDVTPAVLPTEKPSSAITPESRATKHIVVAALGEPDFRAVYNCYADTHTLHQANSKARFIAQLREFQPELSFVNIALLLGKKESLKPTEYVDELRAIWEASANGPLIVVTPSELLREAVKAVKAGASNYLNSPILSQELAYVTESLREFERVQLELDYHRDRAAATVDSRTLLKTRSPLMEQVFAKVAVVAKARTTVMLDGETGVGKSTIAKLIFRQSDRAQKPFIAVHCGAIPDTLLESELFGHERGAFTGAVRRKPGKLEIAQGGTIFLDEVGVLTPAAQIKLLHVLQERCFQRVGGEVDIHADVRVIAASNIELKSLCEQGLFRTDLYYRLNVFPIEIPPLRQRREDIPVLCDHFIQRLRQESPKKIHGVDGDVMRAFQSYHWPGNVRELENLIERAYILESTDVMQSSSFPVEIFLFDAPQEDQPIDLAVPLAQLRQQHLNSIEKEYLERLLRRTQGRIRETAQAAGVGVRQLHKLLTKHQIRKERFKEQFAKDK